MPNAQVMARKNRKLLIRLLFLVVGMVGFAFALVPLYNVFCSITGINGKTAGKVAEAVGLKPELGHTVTLEFISQLSTKMEAEAVFRPQVTALQLHPGEVHRTQFFVRNLTSRAVIFQAVPSIAPGEAASYLHKIECFCFRQQPLKPGEAKWMPVRFYLDNKFPHDIVDMTLSYTLFDVTPKKAAVRTPSVTVNRTK